MLSLVAYLIFAISNFNSTCAATATHSAFRSLSCFSIDLIVFLFFSRFVPVAKGAHINPAVTFGLAVIGAISPLRAMMYITAHCGGGIAGAFLLYG